MLKMLTKPLNVAKIALSLVLLFVILSFFIPSIRGLPSYMKDEVTKKVPDEVLMASAKQELGSYQSKIADYQVKVEGLSTKKDGYQNKVNAIEAEISDLKKGLEIGKEMLQSDKTVFTVKGQEYSRAEIEEDVAKRPQMISKLELEKEMYRDCLVRVAQAQEDGFAKIADMKKTIVEMDSGMELLEVRMMKAKLEAELNKTLSLLSQDFDGDSSYSKTLEEINRRVRKQEIQNDSTGLAEKDLVPLSNNK